VTGPFSIAIDGLLDTRVLGRGPTSIDWWPIELNSGGEPTLRDNENATLPGICLMPWSVVTNLQT